MPTKISAPQPDEYHDYYGGYKGTKKAMDEYFTPLGITPVPLGDKGGTAVVIKQR